MSQVDSESRVRHVTRLTEGLSTSHPLRSDELRACDVRDTVQWFEDIDTGTTLHRSGFIALQAAPCAGTGKTVVVWTLDRLARSMQTSP